MILDHYPSEVWAEDSKEGRAVKVKLPRFKSIETELEFFSRLPAAV